MNIFTQVLRSFLWRSKIDRYAAEKFWKRRKAGDDMRYLFFNEASVIKDLPICFEEEIFNKFLPDNLDKWAIQRQVGYVIEIDDVLVEPERC